MTVTTPTGHVCTVAGALRLCALPPTSSSLADESVSAPLCTLLAPLAELALVQPPDFVSRSQTRRRVCSLAPQHGGARSGYGGASHARSGPRSTVRHVRSRRCSRAGCPHPAASTLTYAYRDSTAVLGPLANQVEPHCYDLCQSHAQSLSAPRGWEVIRLAVEEELKPSTDDLLALADAVRDAGMSYDPPTGPTMDPPGRRHGLVELARRGHLTVLADPGAADAGRRTPT